MYQYKNTTRKERQKEKKDHCNSKGNKYNLKDLIFENLIREPHDRRKPLNTAPLKKDEFKNRYIYAVNRNWHIRIAPDCYRGKSDAVKHETLFHNADVRACGEIYIKDGIIKEINDHSGSYQTSGAMSFMSSFSRDILFALETISAPIAQQELNRIRRLSK